MRQNYRFLNVIYFTTITKQVIQLILYPSHNYLAIDLRVVCDGFLGIFNRGPMALLAVAV